MTYFFITIAVASMGSIFRANASETSLLKDRVEVAAKRLGCKDPAYSVAAELPLFGSNSKTLVFGCFRKDKSSAVKLDPDDIDRIFVLDPANDCGPEIPTTGGDRLSVITSKAAFGTGTNSYGEFYLPKVPGARTYPSYRAADKDKPVTEPILQFCTSPKCSLDTLYVCHKRQWLHLGRD